MNARVLQRGLSFGYNVCRAASGKGTAAAARTAKAAIATAASQHSAYIGANADANARALCAEASRNGNTAGGVTSLATIATRAAIASGSLATCGRAAIGRIAAYNGIGHLKIAIALQAG